MELFDKLYVSLKWYLTGCSKFNKRYEQTLKVLQYAWERHQHEVRKDGVTPGFQHQLEIAHSIRCLKLLNECLAIELALLHDTTEDTYTTVDDIKTAFRDNVLANGVGLLDKYETVNGVRVSKSNKDYYEGLSNCSYPYPALVKMADNFQNLKTMTAVYSIEKQKAQCERTREWILPMGKTVRLRFPEEEIAFEAFKMMILGVVQTMENSHKSVQN